MASHPKTRAWTKAAPVSFDCRWTKPVVRAAVFAVLVNTACRVSASCGTVVIGELLWLCEVIYTLSMPKGLSWLILSLMRMGSSYDDPFHTPSLVRPSGGISAQCSLTAPDDVHGGDEAGLKRCKISVA